MSNPDQSPQTRDEWVKQCAAEFVRLGCEDALATESAEASAKLLEDETGAQVQHWVSPEFAALHDSTYWENDE